MNVLNLYNLFFVKERKKRKNCFWKVKNILDGSDFERIKKKEKNVGIKDREKE